MKRFGRKAWLVSAAAMAMFVAGCDDDSRTIDAPPPAPLAELEGLSELPYAEPAQVQYYEADRAYPYAERAYGVQRAFYDAPPDYGFAYDDVSPYVWESADDWALYAEPWDGDYRYYYYEPEAAYPYFVRDADYGYAYGAGGVLIAMFYPDGRYVPVDVAYRTAPLAGRYYARGRDLRRASRAAQRVTVDERVWVTEAPRVSRSADPWLRAARDDKNWRAWRDRDGDRELRRFEVETRRRQEAASAWRERTARKRVATIEKREDQLEAQALRGRREAVKDDRGDRRKAEPAVRRAEAEARQVEQRKAQQRAQAAAERSRQNRQRPTGPAAAVRERPAQQAEARRAEPAQRRPEKVEQRPHVEPQRQAGREKTPPAQARAPSAAERGRPAATREDSGKGQGRSKERKD